MQELGLNPALARTWFKLVQSAPFMLVQLDEATAATLPAFLATAVRRSFVADDKVTEAAATPGVQEADAIAANLPDSGAVMVGDFGEILTYVLHAALCVPHTTFRPKKWRLKQERNKPAPKSDGVRFILPNWPAASDRPAMVEDLSAAEHVRRDSFVSHVHVQLQRPDWSGHRMRESVMAAKCGFCNANYTDARLAGITVGGTWNGVATCCPRCLATFSAVIDPVALKFDIVSAVSKAIRDDVRRAPSCSADEVVLGVTHRLERMLVQRSQP